MVHPGALKAMLQEEEHVFRPLPQMTAEANISSQEYEAAIKRAHRDYLGYWEEAAEELDWFRKWDKIMDDSDAPFYKWFTGAQCNIVYNALDRHVTTANKNKLALIWEGEPGDTHKLTYYELYREVNRFANALRDQGVGKGDRVLIFMPALPQTIIAMLATAKIGAVHILIFSGYSSMALRDRINDAQPKLVVTVDGFYRNGKVINLKSILDEALAGEGVFRVETVVVAHRANVGVDMVEGRDLWYEDLIRQERAEAVTEVLDSEDTLFLQYTPEVADKPKAVVHTHGGYMVGINRTFNWIFDIKPTDIFLSTADPSWITGHSYGIYGPLIAGSTTVMYEGHPLYPQAGRLWSIIERTGATILYTIPTLIRMLMRFGTQYPKKHDLSTLRLLGTVGEPIHPETWSWFHKHIGRTVCPIIDTWWQTETGMIMISPMPVSLLKPGSVTKPLPGVDADVVDENGKPVEQGQVGLLVIKKPWPAMFRNLYNDPELYKETYWNRFPGMYLAGDAARKDLDGYIWILGRADEALVISGHLIGTVEIESALTQHKAVAEAVVIGIPDKIKGEVAKAFIVLQDGFPPCDDLINELIEHVRRMLGPVAVIRSIEFRDSIPKTETGKILRKVLRAEEFGEESGDISSLAVTHAATPK
jgi:acetyl-CoA synthetase